MKSRLFAFLTAAVTSALGAQKPHLIMILQDDLGHYDLGIHNPAARSYSNNITSLAEEGIILTNHYTHWHCSPTRRSFLTGRLPIHHGEMLSDVTTDDVDLRMTWISEKLKSQGYSTYWYGKGHTGYKSMNHLGINRGFDDTFGYLMGEEAYTSSQRWQNNHPVHTDNQFTDMPDGCNSTSYSSQLFVDLAKRAIQNHDVSKGFFLYLAFQAVHLPYDPVPGNPYNDTYTGMIWDADVHVGEMISLLKEKNMYDNTFIVYTADNGGVMSGNNYPLRGEKHTNWEGGMRTAAFVSGGLIPANLRGTKNGMNLHIVDWYSTFCELAGVSHNDDPPTPPLPTNMSDPSKNIYGDNSYPAVDGVPVFDMLMNPDTHNISSAHEYLVLAKEVIISGEYKLLIGQPHFKWQNNGWRQPNGTWIASNNTEWPCNKQDGPPSNTSNGYLPGNGLPPCLFNVRTDASEKINIGPSNPDIVARLWRQLNETALTTRDCSGFSGPVPGPGGQCSPPELIGHCDVNCSAAFWATKYPVHPHSFFSPSDDVGPGPVCDVPACEKN
eukprot:TRINITY_DN1626_c0_g1_i4.p1 TRINITY_DN1626_c0_g1~~TRINITY_DN1626_c0_g1_i4.p1  ORF type:complete len:552 (+),score=94.24 TRINITY_DN1626_c0_g1_i4:43-1698(+)